MQLGVYLLCSRTISLPNTLYFYEKSQLIRKNLRFNFIIYILKNKMSFLQPFENVLNASGQSQPAISISADCKALIEEKVDNQTKNRKWTDQEHVLYILFLELNRNKIKSKLIRRSNSFYKEMAAFIKGKNGVQCRSHHQKYETRYKFPHKIIREEKEKLDPQLYHSLKSSLSQTFTSLNQNVNNVTDLKQKIVKNQQSPSIMRTVSCQTQIEGVNQVLLQSDQVNEYYKWLNRCSEYAQMKHAQLMMNWQASNSFFHMGGCYMNRPF